MKLALFDLDHTLLNLDSDHEWGEFLIRNGYVDEAKHRAKNDQFYQDYKNGTLDAVAYNEFVFEFLTTKSLAQLDSIRAQYIREVIVPAMRPKGIAKLNEHTALGHTIVIITATNRFVTTPIAAAFGVANLIASEPEILDDKYTGQLVGEPCFQAGKLAHLNQWLAKQYDAVIEESWGYSDSFNDLTLLNLVNHPFVVNGDDRLVAHAEQKNWQTLDWQI